MKNQDISKFFKPLGKFFGQFHLTFFIVLVSIGLALAVLSISSIVLIASTPGVSDSPSGSNDFDQATIDKVDQLHTSSEGSTYSPPAGRINPFAE